MAFFHGEELLLVPGALFLLIAISLLILYNSVKAIYSKHVFQVAIPVIIFVLVLVALFFIAIGAGSGL